MVSMLFSVALKGQSPSSVPSDSLPAQVRTMDPLAEFLHKDNGILNPHALNPFFQSLSEYVSGHRSRIQVVHLGDSHVQMGYWANHIRSVFDSVWGVAAYGSSFPYQLLRYNPFYVTSRSISGKWTGGYNLRDLPDIRHGASGFTVETIDSVAEISIKLRSLDTHLLKFDLLKLIVSDSTGAYNIEVTGNGQSQPLFGLHKTLYTPDGDKLISFSFEEPQDSARIRVKRTFASKGKFQLFGLQFDRFKDKGVVYHNFGVGGSQLTSIRKGFDRVVNQLELIRPDLIILSYGSNDAYYKEFDSVRYADVANLYVRKLKERFPHCSILFTTPPDTRYKNVIPRNEPYITGLFRSMSSRGDIACWDLNSLMKRTGGISAWLNAKLASEDKLHFSRKGYELQANLMMHALLSALDSTTNTLSPFLIPLERSIRNTLPAPKPVNQQP
jgi:lysophospholipase L1-like esterase